MWIGYRNKHGSLKMISIGVIDSETGKHWAMIPDHSSIFFHCTIKLVNSLTLCFFMPTLPGLITIKVSLTIWAQF